MILIDSSGWLQYFFDEPLAGRYYENYLKDPTQVVTPVIVLYEVYKKIMQQRDEESANIAAAYLQETEIVNIDEKIVFLAADLSIRHQLPMADAIIYATARIKEAPLVTSDPHFEGLQGVIFIEDSGGR